MPADNTIMKDNEIQKVKHRYQDVNKNEVKFYLLIAITNYRTKWHNTTTRNGLGKEIQTNNWKHPIGRE